MIDFLGYIRIRVDRDKPLASQPEVYLDQVENRGPDGELNDPPGTIGRLYLETSGRYGPRFITDCEPEFIDVEGCIIR